MPNSPLLGKSVGLCHLNERYGINLVGFEKREHGKRAFFPIDSDMIFETGDAIFLLGEQESADRLIATEQLAVLPALGDRGRRQAIKEVGFAEIMLPPGSPLIGETLKEA